jgi:hypothetical protein
LAVLLDLYSRRVVGWAISANKTPSSLLLRLEPPFAPATSFPLRSCTIPIAAQIVVRSWEQSNRVRVDRPSETRVAKSLLTRTLDRWIATTSRLEDAALSRLVDCAPLVPVAPV